MSDFSIKTLIVIGENVSSPVVLSHSPEKKLTLPQLIAISCGDDNGNLAEVELDNESIARCQRSADYIDRAVLTAAELSKNVVDNSEIDYKQLIYGVNTGFGNNKDKPIKSYEEACLLSKNLIYSHLSAVGDPLPTEVVRATMVIRLRAFIEGRSGVRPELIFLLRDMINNCVHPLIPSQGSLGSSGDLCQLAHLAAVMIGGGKAWHDPEFPKNGADKSDLIRGIDALNSAGLTIPSVPENLKKTGSSEIHLAPKEGLALTNGATVSAAIMALSVFESSVLLKTANIIGSVALQSLGGFSRAFDEKVQDARPYSGQRSVAKDINSYLSDSNLVNAAALGHHQQDEYSIRAIPQVHGAVLNALKHTKKLIEIEINSATDNPLIFIEDDDKPDIKFNETEVSDWESYSAANFHGEPVGLAADYLKIAIAELGSISERRMQLLLDPKNNRGMPANLSTGKGGLDSGMMLYQYTAASLVSENKILCHPSSVDSIPTSANIEDHNAMSTTAARYLRQVLQNVTKVLGAELLVALQALELRVSNDYPLTSHSGIKIDGIFSLNPVAERVHSLIRHGTKDLNGIMFISTDADFYEHPPGEAIELAAQYIHKGLVLLEAEKNIS